MITIKLDDTIPYDNIFYDFNDSRIYYSLIPEGVSINNMSNYESNVVIPYNKFDKLIYSFEFDNNSVYYYFIVINNTIYNFSSNVYLDKHLDEFNKIKSTEELELLLSWIQL